MSIDFGKIISQISTNEIGPPPEDLTDPERFTRAFKPLKKLDEITLDCQYDPFEFFPPGTPITFEFPNGDIVAGTLVPNSFHKEGEVPTMEITIVPSNRKEDGSQR